MDGTLADAQKGLRIITVTKPSRPVRFTDLPKVLWDSLRIKIAMLSTFPGKYPRAASISHCQIEANDPLRFFVVDSNFSWQFGNRLWPIRIIMNPQIVWRGSVMAHSREGCMSYPFTNTVKIRRNETVLVRYWTFFGPRTKQFYLFRAYMVQHELDHMSNTNIYERYKHKKK